MANDPSSSVSVSGITDAQLAAMQQAGLLGGQSGLGTQAPSVDEMQYATQVASPQYQTNYPTPAPSPSVLDSLPTLDETANYLANLPAQAQRLLTNPAAFTEMLTGKNPLPEQTGFAASATGLPPQNPNSLFTPAGMAYNRGYESGEPVSIAAMGVPALAPAGRMLGSAAGERIMAGKPLIPGTNTEYLNPQIMSAVKNKGGNWLSSGLDQLDWMKKPIENVGESRFDSAWDNGNPQKIAHHISEMEKIGYAPEQIKDFKDSVAVNNWIDKKLKNYVRNEMGTPQDPVRELADQGVLHLPQEEIPTSRGIIQQNRAEAGFPEKGFANTPLGQQWERATDYAINPRPAAAYQEHGKLEHRAKRDPWVNKLERSTPVHTATLIDNGLGFEHIIDELKNSITHNSDLPEHLRIKPEALDKMTVPHAVKHVAKINKYRAEQMEKAAKDHLKDFPIVHETGKGYNIHELKLPEVGPEYKFEKIEGNKNHYWKITDPEGNVHAATGTTEENARRQFARSSTGGNFDKLDKALKNEGEQMGHCVGGYTDSVADGSSRIFSLRDDKGGAHATVEATPKILDYNPKYIPQDVQDEIAKYAHSETIKAGYPENTQGYWNHHTGVEIQEGTKYLKNHPVMDIKQIKGKGNREVSDKYRTYIKNWLNKETSKINYVNDLQNVGLHDLKNGLVRQENLDKRLAEGFKSGELKRFSSDEEVRDFMNKPLAKTPEQMRNELFEKSRANEAERKANEPRTLQQRMRDQGLLPPEGHKNGGRIQKFAEGGTPNPEAGTTYIGNLHPDVIKGVGEGRIPLGDAFWMSDYAHTPGQTEVETGKGAFKDQSEKMQNYVGRMERGEVPVPKHWQGEGGVSRGGNSSGLNPRGSTGGGGGGAGYVPGTTNPFNPDSPLNRKNGGKIPSIDEMRLTILRNK